MNGGSSSSAVSPRAPSSFSEEDDAGAFKSFPKPSPRHSKNKTKNKSRTKSRKNLATQEHVSPYVTGDEEEEEEGEEEYNPRSFPWHVKQACWEKAAKLKGRDPDRWRRDALGNIVFRKLVGCNGCLCHDYDHIVPYSKGGKSTLDNCQILQGVANRAKGNRTDMSSLELMQKSAYCRVSGRDMDFMELSSYGNVHRGQESGGCRIQ